MQLANKFAICAAETDLKKAKLFDLNELKSKTGQKGLMTVLIKPEVSFAGIPASPCSHDVYACAFMPLCAHVSVCEHSEVKNSLKKKKKKKNLLVVLPQCCETPRRTKPCWRGSATSNWRSAFISPRRLLIWCRGSRESVQSYT